MVKTTVGIVIDSWKLEVFERHLNSKGYAFLNAGKLEGNTLLLKVVTTDLRALDGVVRAANTEAAITKAH